MPGMANPTMFDDMPTKRPHFFFLIAGKKYFALKKCESRLVAVRERRSPSAAIASATATISPDFTGLARSDRNVYLVNGNDCTNRFRKPG
jgi:hypothetical protein